MKYFVCSDIHSAYDKWMESLNNAGFNINNNDHSIILLGDLCDRDEKPLECLEFVNHLLDKDRIICILGNHEDLLNKAINRKKFEHYDYHNGTVDTVNIIVGRDSKGYKDGLFIPDDVALTRVKLNDLWQRYFKSCKLYYETDHYIFTHAWVSYEPLTSSWNYHHNWRDTEDPNVLRDWYDNGIWANPFKKWYQNGMKGIDGKTIVCGHWNTSWAWREYRGYDKEFLNRVETMYLDSEGVMHPTVCHDIFKDNGIIGLDSCVVVSHKINVLVLEEL